MLEVNVNNILRTVYGVRGLPFPAAPKQDTAKPIAGEFTDTVQPVKERTRQGAPLWGQNVLGRPVFMPAKLNGIELPNPLISITGSKEIKETLVVDKGTVFEKISDLPYDITIICTLIAADGLFPEDQLKQMVDLWRINEALTLECALTDIVLTKEQGYLPENNFILTNLDILDMQGIENAQVIQLTGKSNIEFELEAA